MTQTAGFYKKNGADLLFAPTAVHFPGGTSILVGQKDSLTFPVNGWTFYNSLEDAQKGEGVSEAAVTDPNAQARKARRVTQELRRIEKIRAARPEVASKMEAKLAQKFGVSASELTALAAPAQEAKPEVAAEAAPAVTTEVSPSPSPEVAPRVTPETEAKWKFPKRPKKGQTFTAPDGTEWVYDQPRDENGTFSEDNLETPIIESALQWVRTN